MKIVSKRFLSFLVLFIIIPLLVSCYDTGYEDDNEYYEIFGGDSDGDGADVYTIYSEEDGLDYDDETYGLKENFYNEDTANNFDESLICDPEYYSYLYVRNESDDPVRINQVVLYFKGDAKQLKLRLIVSDDEPDNIRAFNMNSTTLPGFVFGDTYDEYLAESSITLSESFYKDTSLAEFIVSGNKQSTFTLASGRYLIIQFLNNTGYGADLGLEPVKFRMTNLLISLAS